MSKDSPAALKRKIERLETLVLVLTSEKQTAQRAGNSYLHDLVDYKIRNQQAMKLLNGEDV